MDSNTTLGITGATIVLIAYLLNQSGKWSSKSYFYDLANFIGSFLLIIYAVTLKSIPFIILNAVWAFVSIKDVFEGITKKDSD